MWPYIVMSLGVIGLWVTFMYWMYILHFARKANLKAFQEFSDKINEIANRHRNDNE